MIFKVTPSVWKIEVDDNIYQIYTVVVPVVETNMVKNVYMVTTRNEGSIDSKRELFRFKYDNAVRDRVATMLDSGVSPDDIVGFNLL